MLPSGWLPCPAIEVLLIFPAICVCVCFPACWKDNVQTRLNGRGGTHRDAALEAVVATLSCGPVGIGDGLASPRGYGTNASLALATCNTNGSLLQPSRPASGIDDMFTRGWNPQLLELPPSGFISVTHTEAANHSSASSGGGGTHNVSSWLVLVIAAGKQYQLSPDQLFPRPMLGAAPAFWVQHWTDNARCANGSDALATGCLRAWSSSDRDLSIQTGAPTGVSHKASDSFYFPWDLMTLYPRAGNSGKWTLLGEMSKFVRLSPGRVRSVDELEDGGGGLRVCVFGAFGERVTLSALAPGSTVLHSLELLVGDALWEERGGAVGKQQGAWVQCGTFE